MKRLMTLTLTLIILLAASKPQLVFAEDFSKKEDYYYTLCSKTGLSAEDKAICKEFQAYLQQKAIDANKSLAKINNSIADIKKDLNGYMQKVAQYNAQIAAIQRDINKLNESIAIIMNNIELLETRIIIRQENIEKLNTYIKERMKAMQGVSSFDGYVDFIFGAKDFGDFIRRVEGIKDITAYDQEQINQLQEEIRLLNMDKDDLLTQKAILEEQRSTLETNKASIHVLKIEVDKIIVEYRKMEAELQAQQTKAVENLKEIQGALNDVSKALGSVQPSPGWVYPLRGSFSISAGVWNYPSSFGGGRHIGVDFAAAGGRAVVAPGNGIVVFVADRCSSSGYYCSNCGSPGASGGGNQVAMIIQINSSVYMIVNFHLRSGVSKVAKVGQIVLQGDTVGYVGTSGCSTGNHLHQQIVYLGENNMAEMVTKFKNSGKLDMGAGWGNTAYNNRCTARNWKAPCYESPLTIYNVKVGKSYKS